MSRCNAKTEVYSRIVGYFRPVQNWNGGKQAEYKDRVPFRQMGDFARTPSGSPTQPVDKGSLPTIDDLERQIG